MRTKMRAFQYLLGIISLLIPYRGQADYPRPWQMYYQEPVTPVMDHLYDFHCTLLIIEGVIVFLVSALLIFVIIRFRARKNPDPSHIAHNTLLEMIWTAVPVLVLV